MSSRRLKKALKRIINLPKNRYLIYYLNNKMKHFYLRLNKSTTVAYPSTIMLELTNHCNLHCTTCPREYDYGKDMDKGHMPIEQAKKIIDEIWPYLDSVGLTGMGETFLYKELNIIIDYIQSKNSGIIISLSTNAMLPNFIEKVSEVIDKVDTIQVSIDGLGSVYESIRVNASFAKLDENLQALTQLCHNSKTTIMLNMVVTKENYFQMPDLVRYAQKTGIKYLDFTLFNLASVTNVNSSYYDFYKSVEFIHSVAKLEEAITENNQVTVTNKNFQTDNGFQKCPFPWTHFYICWNGFLAPCCAKPFPKELNFGNVFEEKLLDTLNNKAYQTFRQMWQQNKTPDFCNKCHFIDIEPIKHNHDTIISNKLYPNQLK